MGKTCDSVLSDTNSITIMVMSINWVGLHHGGFFYPDVAGMI